MTVSGWEQQRRAARVIARDHGICHVCGKGGADQADHVVPLAEGGADNESNLAAIHAEPCHHNKTQGEAQRARSGDGKLVVPTTPPAPVLLVVGPPASGKTTLLRYLAAELCLPARSIDDCGMRGRRAERWTTLLSWISQQNGPSIVECNVVPPEAGAYLAQSGDMFAVEMDVPQEIRAERLEARGDAAWGTARFAVGVRADLVETGSGRAVARRIAKRWEDRERGGG